MDKKERIAFITDALRQKFRHPGWKVYRSKYGTFPYDPFIFKWARFDFPLYSKSYPDNKVFTEKLVLGLERRDPYLIQITQGQFRENPQDAALNQKFDQQLTRANLDLPQQPSTPPPVAQPSTTTAPIPQTVIPREETNLAEKVSEGAQLAGSKAAEVVSLAPVQDLASKAQIVTAKTISRTGRGLMGFLGEIPRSAGGFLGSGVGAGGNFILKRGGSMINYGADLSNNIARGSSSFSSGVKKSKAKLVLIIIGVILFGSLLFSAMPDNLNLGPGGGLNQDIASCKFIRSDQNPKDESFKSPLLMTYIREASNLTNIPAAVLAAFIRVESPSSVNLTDEQIKSYQCAQSPTGALGIMQIQPPGTKSAKGDPASCDDCIDAGAKLIGKTVSTMSREDYCDPRANIIVGAGWILKKMGNLGYTNNGKWSPAWTNNKGAINALVNTYYGCLLYGGAASCTGPYNYGDDIWNSMQSCRGHISNSYTQPLAPPNENITFYCQGNTAWQSVCSLGNAGCGPTSMAMLLSGFGFNLTPTQVDQQFQAVGARTCGDTGSSLALALNSAWLSNLGMTVGPNIADNGRLNIDLAKEYLNKGYLILGSSKAFPCANCKNALTVDHIFVVDAVNPATKVVDIRDPNNCSYRDGNDENPANRLKNTTDFPWYYAYPMKKVR